MPYGLKTSNKCPTCKKPLIFVTRCGLVDICKCSQECGHKEPGVDSDDSEWVNIVITAQGAVKKTKET